METMKRRTAKWWAVALSVALLLVGVAPMTVHAGRLSGAQATLYEVTENVTYGLDENGVPVRNSTSQLQGAVQFGTPLCPDPGLLTNVKAQTCTVTAVGTSVVPLGGPSVGLGGVSGSFTVVVQELNGSADAPEVVALVGSFNGRIDMQDAFAGIPRATITGATLSVGGALAGTFNATFRLPFAKTTKGEFERAKANREAFYLGDRGELVPVRSNERSLGSPAVRVDVLFAQ